MKPFALSLFCINCIPWIGWGDAHNSTNAVQFSFRTQWYWNWSGSTQVWLIDEQFKIAALASHSKLFLGHLFTGTTVSSDAEHAFAIAVFIRSYTVDTCLKIRKYKTLKNLKTKVNYKPKVWCQSTIYMYAFEGIIDIRGKQCFWII